MKKADGDKNARSFAATRDMKRVEDAEIINYAAGRASSSHHPRSLINFSPQTTAVPVVTALLCHQLPAPLPDITPTVVGETSLGGCVVAELLHRVVLLSGSALSPWALQKEPLAVKRRVAEQTGCHGDLLEDDLAPCLRAKPLADLLAVRVDPPRFLAGFAPFVDGTVLPEASPSPVLPQPGAPPPAVTTGLELAHFPARDLLFGLTTTESYLDLSAQDLEFGFNDSRRDRILRTYVRNAYLYHLNEIFSTLKNEYTDWERPVQNPLSVRDATLEVLSDGHTAAPLIRLGYLHAVQGGRTYFMHFQHQSGETDYPQVSICSTWQNLYASVCSSQHQSGETDYLQHQSGETDYPQVSICSTWQNLYASVCSSQHQSGETDYPQIFSFWSLLIPGWVTTIRKWKPCRTMPLVSGFSRGSAVYPAPSFRRRSLFTSITAIGSQGLARMGSVRGEDVPYVLGLPLVGGQPFFPYNYSRQDGVVSRLFIHYLTNFARTGYVCVTTSQWLT
ncbi:hypothetical protein PR048_032047 [Dryococelus australis]|uniref:Carboxylesterase type B domain-containing protein n=1 Tax=Dryococelus australis TaxID=614101 RepID=A0ABQ9G714_9NEOP|nr:hypothetical protein PR048_032047 [Dryococelus australis]